MRSALLFTVLLILLSATARCQNVVAPGAEMSVSHQTLTEPEGETGSDPSTNGKLEDDSAAAWLRKVVDTEYTFADLSDRFKAAAQQRFLMDQAVLVYAEGAKRYPSDDDAPRAVFVCGEIEKTRGKDEDAMRYCNSVISDFLPNDYSDDAQYGIAWIYYSRKNYEKAQKEFYRLIDSYLRSELIPDSYIMVGQCYQDILSYENAIRTYRKVLDTYDDSVIRLKALTGLAQTYMKTGEFDSAIATYETIRSEYPESDAYDHAEYMLGRAYAMQGDYPAARRTFSRILNSGVMNAYVADATYANAWTYYAEKKYAHAIECYALAMTRYPDHSEYTSALSDIADSYAGLYLYRDALIRYGELLDRHRSQDTASLTPTEIDDLNEKISKTLVTMASIHTERGEYDEALALLFETRRYTGEKSEQKEVDFEIAELYCRLGWYREALGAYDEFLSGNPYAPQLPLVYAHQAKCYDEMGYFKLAEEMYRKVLDLQPEEVTDEIAALKRESVFRIAELYEEQDMVREEAEFLESILREDHEFLDEARLLYKLGTVYEDTGQLENAASAYERILYGFKDSEWFDLAKLNLEIIRINQKSGDGSDG